MNRVPLIIAVTLTVAFTFVLNKQWGGVPALGKFLSPQHGLWQNAEPINQDFSADLKLNGLLGKTEVYFDERLVPHIFASVEGDEYFVQGYIHAKFRLWQMEFQTHSAAGRISEIVGDKGLEFDRTKRRLGMVYAAEILLKEFEANTITKDFMDKYTAGVNAYINTLTQAQLPIEYKLLNYKPEKWSNLKSALFIKQMTETLAGFVDDLPMTSAKGFFSDEQLKILFPQTPDSLQAIVPNGTIFAAAAVHPIAPASADSLYLNKKNIGELVDINLPNPENGSNNWAVAGSKTKSGAPILANDPHLDLSLPSIWYEMQMTTPTMNAYGVSFPGTPGIIIGFNDSIAFGFTNSQRDVRDYYEITFKDDSRKQYWFNNEWKDADQKVETVLVKGKEPFLDTVSYTIFGPVMYDNSFPSNQVKDKNLSVRWTAHDVSNELLMWYYLDRAKNYEDYKSAIQHFTCPAQNMIFASKKGDIAIWQQGRLPALWDRQGVFVMPGVDSSYMWQGYIPSEENPHSVNPERGFVSSANQRPVDNLYPYFIPGGYDLYRGITINKKLSAMTAITPDDMMKLHNENHNEFAATALPLLLKYVDENKLSNAEKNYLNILSTWNFQNNFNEKAPTIFKTWYDSLEVLVWGDEFAKANLKKFRPAEKTLIEALLRDSNFVFIDNINSEKKETLNEIVTEAFQQAAVDLAQLEKDDKLIWSNYQNTTVYHLLKNAVLPFAKTGLMVGGGQHVVNATQHSHGPSWRMVVHMTNEIEAYGVYPGGQSGNPGSKFYDSFIGEWAAGKYYSLWFMHQQDTNDKRVKWKMSFDKI